MLKPASVADKKPECCPDCGAPLVMRSSRRGPFQGCSRYPTCEYVRPLKTQGDGHIVKALTGQTCPRCESTLVLRQGRYGMFIGCSNYPQCDHTEVIDRPDETLLICPQCKQGKLLQRKSRFGKMFYSCERYPACQFAVNHKPVMGVCPACQYPLLIEKKTAQGLKFFCASKACGKPVLVDSNTHE